MFEGIIGTFMLVYVLVLLGTYVYTLRKGKLNPGDGRFVIGMLFFAPVGEYNYLCWLGYTTIQETPAAFVTLTSLAFAGAAVSCWGILITRAYTKNLIWQVECLKSPDKPSLS